MSTEQSMDLETTLRAEVDRLVGELVRYSLQLRLHRRNSAIKHTMSRVRDEQTARRRALDVCLDVLSCEPENFLTRAEEWLALEPTDETRALIALLERVGRR